MSKTPLQARQLSQLPARNLIINGNFDFWQRGTSFTVSSSSVYTADRFNVARGSGTGVLSATRSTNVPSFEESNFSSSFSLRSEVTTAEAVLAAGSIYTIQQRIEGFNYAMLHNKKARIQFWVRTNKLGTYTFAMSNGAVTRRFGQSFIISQANTWTKVVFNVDMDNQGTWDFSNGIGVYLFITLAAGSNYTSTNVITTPGVWVSSGASTWLAVADQVNMLDTIGNYIEIAQCFASPIDVSEDIPFSRAGNTIQAELAMCQRYYEKSYDIEAVPGSIANTGVEWGTAGSTTQARLNCKFKVPKRSSGGTITLYSPDTGTTGIMRVQTTESAAVVVVAGASGFGVGAAGIGSVDAQLKQHWTSDAEL